jgi:PTS system N-acetylgalactosamine-specific IIB component
LNDEGGLKMLNLVLVRIDNRLVHGQVATQWCGSVGANLLLVSNDEVSTNTLRQGLMDMAAPSYAQTRYWSIDKTIKNIHKASDKQKVFIVCETPQDVLKLVEGGVPIKKVNIGNMHMSEGKRQVVGSVAVDASDIAAFKRMQELGVELEIRRVPTESAEDIRKLFK